MSEVLVHDTGYPVEVNLPQKIDSFDTGGEKNGVRGMEVLSYPYKGPSLPIAETMITLLAVSSHTCHSNKALFG